MLEISLPSFELIVLFCDSNVSQQRPLTLTYVFVEARGVKKSLVLTLDEIWYFFVTSNWLAPKLCYC